jgi:hypothetical protein
MLFKDKNKPEEKDPAHHHAMTPMAKKTNDLSREGFTDQFVLVDGGLKSSEKQKIYKPEELTIKKHWRFEGSSDPGDMTILYAIETADGNKGTIIDGYGTYSDVELSEFMKHVQEDSNANNPAGNQSTQVEERLGKERI